MTLEEAQKQVDSWIKEYGVRYFSELTNMAILTEEVGELARVMARKYGFTDGFISYYFSEK
jgi:NTP pyrophosphatase (non-canonical NTP hydrolase)